MITNEIVKEYICKDITRTAKEFSQSKIELKIFERKMKYFISELKNWQEKETKKTS